MPRDDKGGKRKHGQRCVAANCANTHANNVNLHEFSRIKDEARKRAWTQFVKTNAKTGMDQAIHRLFVRTILLWTVILSSTDLSTSKLG